MPEHAVVHAVALACPSSGVPGAVAHDDVGLQVQPFQDGASVAQHRAMQPAAPARVDCDVAWALFGDGGLRESDALQQDELQPDELRYWHDPLAGR